MDTFARDIQSMEEANRQWMSIYNPTLYTYISYNNPYIFIFKKDVLFADFCKVENIHFNMLVWENDIKPHSPILCFTQTSK